MLNAKLLLIGMLKAWLVVSVILAGYTALNDPDRYDDRPWWGKVLLYAFVGCWNAVPYVLLTAVIYVVAAALGWVP